MNSIHLLKVVKVLEKGLEQHTKKKSEGFPVGFCKPGNFSETGTTKNLWFGVVPHSSERVGALLLWIKISVHGNVVF